MRKRAAAVMPRNRWTWEEYEMGFSATLAIEKDTKISTAKVYVGGDCEDFASLAIGDLGIWINNSAALPKSREFFTAGLAMCDEFEAALAKHEAEQGTADDEEQPPCN